MSPRDPDRPSKFSSTVVTAVSYLEASKRLRRRPCPICRRPSSPRLGKMEAKTSGRLSAAGIGIFVRPLTARLILLTAEVVVASEIQPQWRQSEETRLPSGQMR